MTATKAYIAGWKATLKTQRMWWLFYGIMFVMALISTLPVKGFLTSSIGNSLALEKSLPGFDYTFFGDLLNEYGFNIDMILNQSIVMVLLFYLVSVFLTGGLLAVFKERPIVFDGAVFWSGCSLYFWRVLRLSIYFIIIHLVLLGLFTMLYFSLSKGMDPFKAENEDLWINNFRILTVIYLLLASFIFVVHDTAKWHMVHTGSHLLVRPFWQSFRIVFKKLGRFLLLFLLNLFTFLLFFGIYYFLKNTFEANTTFSIFLLFLLSQLFIWLRVGLKFLNLAGIGYLYEGLFSGSWSGSGSGSIATE